MGRYSHAIFSKDGGWPPSIEKQMLKVSLAQGYKESRLPPFTEEEKKFVRGIIYYYLNNFLYKTRAEIILLLSYTDCVVSEVA